MRIFVVDDERIIRVSLADELKESGFEVYEFAHANAALMQMRETKPDLVITDLKMPDIDGVELLKRVKETDPNIFVILMTAYSTVSTAVETMKLGAYDYIEKPFDNQNILLIIERIIELKKVKEENKELKIKLHQNYDFSSFVGDSPAIDKVFDLVKIVAKKDTSILIIGETGTGKELLTNIIHYNCKRNKNPLIKVSCAILNRDIFESELFGHVKGAFTGAVSDKIGRFEMANGGTLYLDDIDDIPLDLQVKLLRALEEGEIERVGGSKVIKVNIRLIASTKKNLQKMVDEGTFREDLYYRLHIFPIVLPPLRERSKDIVNLTKHFVSVFAPNENISIDDNALNILKKYPFRGNVRELKNLAERLTLLSVDNKITADILPYEIKYPDVKPGYFNFENMALNNILENVEMNAIQMALDKTHGNKAKASELLHIPASTLKSKIIKYKL